MTSGRDWRPTRAPGLGLHAREVTLGPGRGADEQVARLDVAAVGQRMRHVARSERQLARARGDEVVADLERQLALDHVERLVEVVRVQVWPLGAGRDHDVDRGDDAVGLFAASRTWVWSFIGFSCEAEVAQERHDEQGNGGIGAAVRKTVWRASPVRVGGEQRAEHRDADGPPRARKAFAEPVAMPMSERVAAFCTATVRTWRPCRSRSEDDQEQRAVAREVSHPCPRQQQRRTSARGRPPGTACSGRCARSTGPKAWCWRSRRAAAAATACRSRSR